MGDRDRRGYNPSDYVPPNDYPADDRRRSTDRYGDSGDSYRYQRSTYDSSSAAGAGANNYKQLSRDPYYGGGGRTSDYYDDGYDDRRLDRYDSGRSEARSRSRRDKSRNRSRSGKSERRERSRSGSGSRDNPLSGRFGKEKKDIAATAIGAIAGAFLGHEAGRKHGHAATIGGALLGGLAANAIEHQHLKKQQERREREYEYDDEYDDNDYGRRGR